MASSQQEQEQQTTTVEAELEKKLLEAGNSLLSPPSSVSDLLSLLDRVENCLTRVEQSPSESMKTALKPSMRALIADDLLKHSDTDVKVSVAACISEITRITAPDAPYDDDQMKEVFLLIVSSFENLNDKSSPSYNKRFSVLETVAKVRSCVVMLDLECDSLILEMFNHFFRCIRDDHEESVFSSMETIMSLVLEESEDIPLDLLSTILHVLKKDNKEVLPVSRQLAEKVVEKCDCKLKPYLLQAVKSQGASLTDFSKVVASACQSASEVAEPGDGDVASKNLAEDNDLTKAQPKEKADEVAMETLDDAPPSEEVGPIVAESPKSVMSNGNLQKDGEETGVGTGETKDADPESNDGINTDAEPSNPNTDSVGSDEQPKPKSKAERSKKRKGRKPVSSKNSLELDEATHADDKQETNKIPELQQKDQEDVGHLPSEAPESEVAGPAENEKESGGPIPLPKASENVPVDAPLSSPSGSLADESRPKDDKLEKKDDLVQEGSPEDDVSENESEPKKVSKGTGNLRFKSKKRSGKKASSASNKEESVPDSVDESTKEGEDENASNSDTETEDLPGKKVESASAQREDKKKKGQGKGAPAKNLAKSQSKDEKPVPKSTSKSTKAETDAEKTSKSSSKRKRSPAEEKASGANENGGELIGCKIKVWWPDDEKFYKGVVETFDKAAKTHTVLYDDGDVEVLNLADEQWELVKGPSSLPRRPDIPDVSTETPKGKKAKTSGDSGTKLGKTDSMTKKGAASSSKSKAASKSGRKVDVKVKETPKGTGKSAIKGGKTKDVKGGNKSSDLAEESSDEDVDTPMVGQKSKGKNSKSSSKSKLSGTGKAKAGSVKDVSEDESSPEPVKTPVAKGKSPSASKSQKSSKKRKRRW